MTTLTEAIHQGEFLLSEGNGEISREAVTVAQGTGIMLSGTLLGRVTATSKLAAYNNAASDGTQTAVGILWNELPPRASAGDARATMIARDAEVSAARLTGLDTPGRADLALIGIIVR
jgi:hypothetical protein